MERNLRFNRDEDLEWHEGVLVAVNGQVFTGLELKWPYCLVETNFIGAIAFIPRISDER